MFLKKVTKKKIKWYATPISNLTSIKLLRRPGKMYPFLLLSLFLFFYNNIFVACTPQLDAFFRFN
jgi:hypothetical protein